MLPCIYKIPPSKNEGVPAWYDFNAELQLSALQFMLSVSFNVRWHSSFQDGGSITLTLDFNDSWDGKTNLGGENGFSILGSQSCAFSMAFMENNNRNVEYDTVYISYYAILSGEL